MKIIYYPDKSDENRYVAISQECLSNLGVEVVPFSMKEVFNRKEKADYLFLNWYENIGTSHSCALMWFLCINSDKIIILSKQSKKELQSYLSQKEIDRKAFYIPHPNYIGQYPCQDNSAIEKVADVLNVVFVGAVKPYKNIELIIEIAQKYQSEKVRFHIAGKPCNEIYKRELEQKCADIINVELTLRFLEDWEIAGYVMNADIIILPYDVRSSVNSGTVLLAFSYGKTVICPKIAIVQDFDSNLLFSYDYSDEKEHYLQLERQVEKVIQLYKTHSGALEEKGIKLQEFVRKNHSIKVIQDKYKTLLEK